VLLEKPEEDDERPYIDPEGMHDAKLADIYALYG
jgi:hypothetical protein